MDSDTLRGLGAGISIGIVLMNILLAVVVHRVREQPGYTCLRIGAWLAGSGLLLNMLQGSVPTWLSLALGNALLVAGQVMLWVGVERALGRRRSRAWLWVLTSLMFSIGIIFGVIWSVFGVRLVAQAVLLAVPTAILLRTLSRQDRPSRALRWLLYTQTLILACLFARVLLHLAFDIPKLNPFENEPGNIVVVLGLLVGAMASVMCMILFVVERLVNQSELRAESDPLTECMNRLGLRRLIDARRKSKRMGPISVLALDLDHFKRINDVHGHDVGDAVLRRFARVSRAELGADDVLIRMGGEEFLVLSERTDQSAIALAEAILAAVAAPASGEPNVTVSIGVVPRASLEIGVLREAFQASDEALYRAKREGRNRVCVSAWSGHANPAANRDAVRSQ